jgi:hypothetical protein
MNFFVAYVNFNYFWLGVYSTYNTQSLKCPIFRNVDYLNQRVTRAHVISITVRLPSGEKEKNQYLRHEKKILHKNTGTICGSENV